MLRKIDVLHNIAQRVQVQIARSHAHKITVFVDNRLRERNHQFARRRANIRLSRNKSAARFFCVLKPRACGLPIIFFRAVFIAVNHLAAVCVIQIRAEIERLAIRICSTCSRKNDSNGFII